MNRPEGDAAISRENTDPPGLEAPVQHTTPVLQPTAKIGAPENPSEEGMSPEETISYLAELAANSGDEDLPEEFELTPEDVEDEAIRGDFMLRWAVILLAVLLGVREVNETGTLVRIRSGEAIRANGLWPPAQDAFSYTAAERTWINLGWMSDVIFSVVYETLGATGLSLLTGLIAATTFYLLSQISRPGLPTWWGSVCAALALLACHLQFTAMPEIVTLLGAVWVLRNLTQWSNTGNRGHLWCLVASLAVWSNLDSRAYVGAGMVALYLIGTALSRYLRPGAASALAVAEPAKSVNADAIVSETSSAKSDGADSAEDDTAAESREADSNGGPGSDASSATAAEHPGEDSEQSEGGSDQTDSEETVRPGSLVDLAMCAGGCVLALMLNPFGWHAILAPLSYYGSEVIVLRYYHFASTERPEILQLFGLLEPGLFEFVNHHIVAGLLVILASLVLSGLAVRRFDAGLTLIILAGVVACLFCLQTLPVAALAAAAAATLAGQDWYRDRFRQTYSTDRREVLFSRGGRAVTVLALAVTAWMGISGRLIGVDGAQPGLGLSAQLEMKVEGIAEDLERAPAGEIFTARMEHGDLLIWNNRRAFFDSRVRLYLGPEEDFARLHDEVRFALRLPESAPDPDSPQASRFGNRELWLAVFNRFGVSTVSPRMWGNSPDYDTWSSLMISPDWTLLHQGGTSALFVRNVTAPDPGRTNLADLPSLAFVKDTPAVPERAAGRPPNFTEKILSATRPVYSSDLLKARHYNTYLRFAMQGMPTQPVELYSLSTLAIRHAGYALADDSSGSDSYLQIAQAAAFARDFETATLGEKPSVQLRAQRYLQLVHAINFALRFEPDNISLLARLAMEYEQARRVDLAIDAARRCVETIAGLPPSATEDEFAYRQQVADEMRALSSRYDEMQKTVEEQLIKFREEENLDTLVLAGMLRQQGFILRAQKLIEADATLAGSLQARLVQAFLFSESGQAESAAELFNTLEQVMGGEEDILPWTAHAAWVNMSVGDYAQAESLCRKRIRAIEELGDKFKGSPTELADLKWTLVRCGTEGGQLSRIKTPLIELQKSIYHPLAALILNEIEPESVIRVEEKPQDEPEPANRKVGPGNPSVE